MGISPFNLGYTIIFVCRDACSVEYITKNMRDRCGVKSFLPLLKRLSLINCSGIKQAERFQTVNGILS